MTANEVVFGVAVNLAFLFVVLGLYWYDSLIPEDLIPPWDNM